MTSLTCLLELRMSFNEQKMQSSRRSIGRMLCPWPILFMVVCFGVLLSVNTARRPQEHGVHTAVDISYESKSREWFLNHPLTFSRHELPSKGRVSQAPLISGDTFRSMADFLYDETSDPPGAGWGPTDVRRGDIIFVKTDMLFQFFTTRHPKIPQSYILVSHNRCGRSSRPLFFTSQVLHFHVCFGLSLLLQRLCSAHR